MLSIGFKNTTELSAYFRRPNFFSLPDLAGALKSSSPLGPAHAGARLSSNPRRGGSGSELPRKLKLAPQSAT